MSSTLPENPSQLGLILSYHCQCACAHCLYNCGPGWSEWMAEEDVEPALQVASAWEKPMGVHLTGGEPFLNFPLLVHAVQVSAQLQLFSYAETNAGWCLQGDLVYDRFEQLKEAGLHAIIISCSPFHATAIPLKRTLLAIAVGLEVFGSDRVIVSMVEWLDQLRRFSFDKAIPLEQYIESYGPGPAGVMFWQGNGLIAGGRSGFRLGHLTHRRPASAYEMENCHADILYPEFASLDLYGNYIPGFCSGLSLGQWRHPEHLNEVLAGSRLSPLISVLVESCPYGLNNYAVDRFGYKPLHSGYVGKCHLCVDVRHHLAEMGDFQELAPRKFYDSL